MSKRPIIIDCDTGHDDAIALLLALGSPEVELKAVTTTAGNNVVDKTFHNTLKLLSHIGVTDIPVAKGAESFFFQPHKIADHVHGDSGLDGPELAEPSFGGVKLSAVELIEKTVRESAEKITLCPMGPLTNIATFVLSCPDLLPKIERISFMGGSAVGGNASPVAEFNTWQDPEAAQIVLKSGVPITMCSLDATFDAYITAEEKERFRQIGNKAGILTAELLDFFGKFHAKVGNKGAPMHDACAVAAVINPALFEMKRANVSMDLNGTFTRGCTTTDITGVTGRKQNCDVTFGVDREAFVELLYSAVKNLQ